MKKSDVGYILVMIVSLAVILVGGFTLSNFELTGNNMIDFILFVGGMGAIIVGVLSMAFATINRRKEE